MSTVNRELSRRFTELFSTGDEALADEVLAEDVVFHGTAGDGELRGAEATKQFVRAYRRAFPDARSTVEQQVAEGDTVVTRWRARGTHRGPLGPVAPTGRPFDIGGITIERIVEGRIAEVWVARDELGLLAQLGVLGAPEPGRERSGGATVGA
ncbi:MAG TPA: ester cyclase [Baekduia sp.]|nr:ester cyclase [Baekduia sp.]